MKNKVSQLILAVLALVWTSGAYAEVSCPEFMPRPFSKIETKIDIGQGKVIEAKDIDCSKIGIAADMIVDIDRMVAPELSTPRSLVFRMVDTFDNAFFSREDVSLNVPYQLMIGAYAKNPVHTVPVWAHEYGHAILEHNLASITPVWIRGVRKGVDSDERARAIVRFIVSPYHEFFADVVAVLYTGRGDAVARSLFMTGYVNNPEGSPKNCPNTQEGCRPKTPSGKVLESLVTPRDFTSRSNQLGRWRGTSPKNAHGLLAPARYDIWKYYLSNPVFHGERDMLAGVTVDAIIADISRRLNRMVGSNGQITDESFARETVDVERVNYEFIQTLSRSFEKRP